MTLLKPKEGSPCNGCGVCCMTVPCSVAETVLDVHEGACPALEFSDGRHWCGFIRNAHKHVPGMLEKPWVDDVFRKMLMETGAFSGVCDSSDE